MNYIIHTPSAVRLKKEILESVSNNRDARSLSNRLQPEVRKNGKDIVTWKCVETKANGKSLYTLLINGWRKEGVYPSSIILVIMRLK